MSNTMSNSMSNNTSFIHYKNKTYLFNEIDNLPIKYKWIVVKNNDIPNIIPLTKMYRYHIELGCVYSENIMKIFDTLVKY